MPLALLFMCLLAPAGELTLSGTTFLLDGQPFPYTGISFFNAIYSPAFNRDADQRTQWLEKFRRYGLNVLRVWAQWDSRRGYADTSRSQSSPSYRAATEGSGPGELGISRDNGCSGDEAVGTGLIARH